MSSRKKGLAQTLFNKQIGKPKLIKPLFKAAGLFLLAALTVYIPMAGFACYSNSKTDSKRSAAILVSAHAILGNDHWLPPLAFLGSYPSWTLYFNKRGMKTEYFLSATSDDLRHVILSDRYQSVVLVGHGSFNHWRATDDSISVLDIQRMAGKYSKKDGEWFQLSCALREFSDIQLGEPVMASGRSYAYSGEAGMIHFVLDAITPFWIIKADTHKRYGP